MTRRSVTALGAALVATAFALFVGPTRVEAHAELVASTPAASSVLDASPPVIALDFDENIDVPLTSIELFDQNGSTIAVGAPTEGADASIVESTVPTIGTGTYAVVWRVSSDDGHIVSGAFSFQIGTTSDVDAAKLLDTVVNGTRADPAVGRSLGVARFAAFLGAALLLGGLGLVYMIDPGETTIGWAARRLLWIGWLLLIIGSAANFALLGANAQAGSVGDALDTSVWGRIADTRTGGLLVARLGIGVALLLPVLLTVGKRNRSWWRSIVPGTAAMTILTFSGAGHPSVEEHPLIWIGIDALHLGFVVLWMGSLAMMAVGGRDWLRDDEHIVAVRRFSRMATIGIPVIVITGVIQTWRIGGGLTTLTDTSWGRLLLAKGAVAVLLVTIGGASRWLLHNDGPGGLRRTVVTETLLGVAVLGLAAGLVGSAPRVDEQSRIYSQSLTDAGVIVDVTITPGHVGGNEVHMVVTPSGGNLTASAGLTARMTLPSRDIPSVPVNIVAESPNHFTGNVTLPFSGDWTLEIVVSPQPSQSIVLSSTVEIPDSNP